MICPSKLSPGQRAKLTEQEIADIYLIPGSRWRDGLGRFWLVFNRQGTLMQDEQGRFKAVCHSVELINLANESRTEVAISEAASRIRMGVMSRVLETVKIQ
jgi:hypothetical protein